jgi:hypothetical protein
MGIRINDLCRAQTNVGFLGGEIVHQAIAVSDAPLALRAKSARTLAPARRAYLMVTGCGKKTSWWRPLQIRAIESRGMIGRIGIFRSGPGRRQLPGMIATMAGVVPRPRRNVAGD